MSADAIHLAFAGILPKDDGNILAQSWEFIGIAGHHKAVLRELALKICGIEVDTGIDDGLDAINTLHAIEECLQP